MFDSGCCLCFPFPEEATRNEWLIVRFSVFQRLNSTISASQVYAMTPVTQCFKSISIFIHSFIYFCLLKIQCGYFFAVSFVRFSFHHCRSDNFFVSTMQMVHLILAHSLLLDINKSLMSTLPFIFLHMTVTPYSLFNILLSNNLLVSEMCLMSINDNVASILHLIC